MPARNVLVRLERKLTVENLWLFIIASLLEGPTYAYDVRRRIRKYFGFSPSTITLYAVIYMLRREGLIRVASEQPKTYGVTEDGARALAEAVRYLEVSVDRIRGLMKRCSCTEGGGARPSS
ncbi:MAG: PadR family transcriptional regulator [Desulfurococcales archaeon ex4484_204]|nr:MAG: PadR family transcriptional regulator [Desulfurococcales archaeon ex4484_204]